MGMFEQNLSYDQVVFVRSTNFRIVAWKQTDSGLSLRRKRCDDSLLLWWKCSVNFVMAGYVGNDLN